MTKPQSNIITYLKIMQTHYAVILWHYRLIVLFVIIYNERRQCIELCDVLILTMTVLILNKLKVIGMNTFPRYIFKSLQSIRYSNKHYNILTLELYL